MAKVANKEMKEFLLGEKKKLEGELNRFAHRNTNSASTDYIADFPHRGDKQDENAAEVAVYSDNLSLEQELEKQLRDVESALERIEKGTFGICKYCNSEISEGRLKIRPTSASCIECKKTLTQSV